MVDIAKELGKNSRKEKQQVSIHQNVKWKEFAAVCASIGALALAGLLGQKTSAMIHKAAEDERKMNDIQKLQRYFSSMDSQLSENAQGIFFDTGDKSLSEMTLVEAEVQLKEMGLEWDAKSGHYLGKKDTHEGVKQIIDNIGIMHGSGRSASR